jgi:methylmalonyl-CoA/ethylmalonyl-CoA epimerase
MTAVQRIGEETMLGQRPTIRHIAIVTLDPERLAQFYCDTFQMTRIPAPGANGSKARFVTDGYLTLALLENRAEGKPSGINHFGFVVEDQDEIAGLMEQSGVRAPAKRPADRAFAETRGTDPDGNMFDLSVRGYDMSQPPARAVEPADA